MRRNILFAVLAIVASSYFIAPPPVSGQAGRPAELPRDDDKQVLRALLDEVRQLRVAIQRANVVSHRLQVTLERIRLQQARVDSVSRALEGVRSRLADLRSARPQMDEQIKYAKELADKVTDPTRRSGLEQEIKAMEARLNGWAREEEQLRAREAELSSESQVEQSKLGELHNQLENMVRELEAP